MTTRVLITDDSALARKQLARSFPSDFDADVSFAENGKVAVELLKEQSFDVMFLDLTMPVMDGYETLDAMKKHRINVPVYVVSGDIQPKAQERVLRLGAKAFVKKPVSPEKLEEILTPYKSIRTEPAPAPVVAPSAPSQPTQSATTAALNDMKVGRREMYMEVVNVAMGRAADSLARFFDVFVHMPLPQVNVLEVSELVMTVRHLANNDNMSGICQGFSGEGLAGEALMLISDSSMKDLLNIMDYPDDGTVDNELEVMVDVSNVLISAFLSGIGEQAGLVFAQSYPEIIGQHLAVDRLVEKMQGTWKRTVTIEVSYAIDGTNIKCDLLLLLVDDSLPLLDAKLAYLMDDED
ncbi:response regulator [Enterovibrio sp. ZSDZ35]|uniref:Response regulator n=1 Tax=Enterovibrio qingdaonensis TaxID=2899818 RepID=A0ABT5QFU4_9GAMM|nr:response regulator [Enterovibrio sp. ZSDZ35]MDD1779812.1 response regulator [Enterovibrio sp. ZSDZ35]